MSGIRRITASTIELLADNPIHGPTHDQRLIAAPLTTGLQHIPTQFKYTTGNVAVGPSGTGILTSGGVLTTGTPLYALLPNSNQMTVTNATNVGTSIQFPGLTYGIVRVEFHALAIPTSAAAFTFPATSTQPTYVIDIAAADNLGTVFPSYDCAALVTGFASAQQRNVFATEILVPYNALRTTFSIAVQAINNGVAADNSITFHSSGSVMYFTVVN